MAIHNLHVLILKKKGVKDVDASGDGTGYSLTIKKHYASETERRRDKTKEADASTKKAFIYSFKILDLATRMYIAYGMSMRSEKEAFDKALAMLKDSGTEIGSIRLDKYYSFPSYVDRFEETKVYVIPRKNATLRGSWKWKRTMREFVWFGWKIEQKREDRIDTALACTNIWHNLFNLY